VPYEEKNNMMRRKVNEKNTVYIIISLQSATLTNSQISFCINKHYSLAKI